MIDIPNISFDTIDGLGEELNLNKSRLDELQNQILTEGYDIANTARREKGRKIRFVK